jgi:SAM-dependent MidA family methyltransferase
MNPLESIIRDEIHARGPMRFDRFMELALYDRRLGYYGGKGHIGRAGDFFTSVSVGPLFGRLLARQILQMVELLADEPLVWIVEQGAHDGQLARDILEELGRWPAIRQRIRYLIVEPSTDSQVLQEQTIGGRSGEVTWAKGLDAWKAEKPAGIFISNELVDAMPVRLIEARDEEWLERFVTAGEEGQLGWVLEPLDDDLRLAVAELPLVPVDRQRAEIGLAARRWMEEVAAFLRRGYVLTIDYGFPAAELYAPHRRDGTLTTYRNHRRGDDVLHAPGEQDITAHVDFTALARVGERSGWQTLALVDQQRFLTGILHDAGLEFDAKEVRAFQTLTHPEFLGARFKVLALAKDAPAALDGLRFARGGNWE